MPRNRAAERLNADSSPKSGRDEAERFAERPREMAGVRIAEVRGERREADALVGKPVESGSNPQLIAVAEERETGVRPEESAQLET